MGYIDALEKYADLSGRATRTEYWTFTLVNLLVILGITLVTSSVERVSVYVWVYTAIVFLPSLAVSVRRLHDTASDPAGGSSSASFLSAD